jgi:hypothetical protein
MPGGMALLQSRGHALGHVATVLALEEHRHAHHGFAMAVLGRRALPNLRAHSHLADGADVHRRAA